MSIYEVRLNHWTPSDGYTHSETIDWLPDATTALDYIENYDGEIEPYCGENGDTEVEIIEHLGGADDPEVPYSRAWLSFVKEIFLNGDTHAQPLTSEQLSEPVTSYDNTSIYEEVIT